MESLIIFSVLISISAYCTSILISINKYSNYSYKIRNRQLKESEMNAILFFKERERQIELFNNDKDAIMSIAKSISDCIEGKGIKRSNY